MRTRRDGFGFLAVGLWFLGTYIALNYATPETTRSLVSHMFFCRREIALIHSIKALIKCHTFGMILQHVWPC